MIALRYQVYNEYAKAIGYYNNNKGVKTKMTYALIDSFKGRDSPLTAQPVHILLFRNFNPQTLQDTYKVELVSGNKHEIYRNLCYSQAIAKFQSNVRWWS